MEPRRGVPLLWVFSNSMDLLGGPTQTHKIYNMVLRVVYGGASSLELSKDQSHMCHISSLAA